MDVNILKEDTGYLSVIERPHAATSSGTLSSRTSAHGPKSSSSGSGSHSPDIDAQSYTEPLSEGEEDEYDGALAPARDEGKRTGLSGDEVNAAIAYREQMLKQQREEDEKEGKDKQKMASSSKNGKAKEVRISDTISDGASEGQGGSSSSKHRPKLSRKSTLDKNLKTKTLAIDPMAPSSAFDQTLKNKLDKAKSESEQEQNGAAANGTPNQRPDIAEEEAALGGLARVQDDASRVLERNYRAPEGKMIAVPVRIEPKVYFAAERTFLVSACLDWLFLCGLFVVRLCSIFCSKLPFLPIWPPWWSWCTWFLAVAASPCELI